MRKGLFFKPPEAAFKNGRMVRNVFIAPSAVQAGLVAKDRVDSVR